MCYRAKFRRSRSDHLGIGRSTKNLGDAWALPIYDGCGCPLVIYFSHLCYHAKFSHSRSNHTSTIMEICQKNLNPQAPKVIGTDTDQSCT